MSANIFGSAEDISSTNTNAEATTSGTTSGDFHLRDGGSGGTLKFKVKTPAAVGGLTINFPGPILFETDVHASFTTEHVKSATVFHSK